MTIAKSPPTQAQGKAMRRVLSGGSTGSAPGSVTTPKMGYAPLSPASGSGGTRTPTGRRVRLPAEDAIPPLPGRNGIGTGIGTGVAGSKKDAELVENLDSLQVRSPPAMSEGAEEGQDQLMATPKDNGVSALEGGDYAVNGTTGKENSYRPPDRSFSSSTESSSSDAYHPMPPSQLGSVYGVDGFPAGDTASIPPSGDSGVIEPQFLSQHQQQAFIQPNQYFGYGFPKSGSPDQNMNAAVAAAIAKADAAVRALNGTATVYGHSNMPQMSAPASAQDGYDGVPKEYANFVRPQNRPLDHGVSRQSSTSSSTTEDSTSSEESDWCIPTVEWVQRDVPGGGTAFGPSQPGMPWNPGYPIQPQSTRNGNAPHTAGQSSMSAANLRKGSSPARMPPPSSTRVTSPRFKQNGNLPLPPLVHQHSLPVGASAHTPTGLRQGSALPPGTRHEAEEDDDDDDQTVGHRERSPSTSSQSTGLDLLWRAVTHTSSSTGEGGESYDEPYDSKGKRKAGATEAVDQWRKAGIPTGVGARHRRQSTVSTEDEGSRFPSQADWSARQKDRERERDRERDRERERERAMASHPQKKRRRSSALDEVDPTLRDQPANGDGSMVVDEDPEVSSESSIPDDGASEGDSEYGDTRGRKPSGRGRVSGRKVAGRGGRQSISVAANPGGSGSKAATPTLGHALAMSSGAGSSPAKKSGSGAGGGGAGKKTDSPNGAGKGGRKPSGSGAIPVPAGGVQCEYVNPLPPYNRCQDIFTRKYDLPRHMARHARREGELVYEGKLAEDKATLWQTIKDKPKVSCPSCGESFTRMDALKRHQAKQNH